MFKNKFIYFVICLVTYISVFIVELFFINFVYTLLNIGFLFYSFSYVVLLILVNPFLTFNLVEYIIKTKWINM
ncbi:MAG: hypothetical protein MR601_08045 [Erysipelotrichaceae bacterium]|nr:hypothetical protein [Erysipelotrichaceae bacterium]